MSRDIALRDIGRNMSCDIGLHDFGLSGDMFLPKYCTAIK